MTDKLLGQEAHVPEPTKYPPTLTLRTRFSVFFINNITYILQVFTVLATFDDQFLLSISNHQVSLCKTIGRYLGSYRVFNPYKYPFKRPETVVRRYCSAMCKDNE